MFQALRWLLAAKLFQASAWLVKCDASTETLLAFANLADVWREDDPEKNRI